jgi:hypothetical protein
VIPIHPADAFVDACGVNVRLHHDSPPTLYTSDFPRVKQLLLDAKLRHIRDSLISPSAPWYVDRHNGWPGRHPRAAHRAARPGAESFAETMFLFRRLRGPNEPDWARHPDWVAETRGAVCLAAVHRRGFALLSPSLTSWARRQPWAASVRGRTSAARYSTAANWRRPAGATSAWQSRLSDVM